MQLKKKAAFIDHSFHKKTCSSDFIKELLLEYFDITYYYDESWQGGEEIDIDDLNDNNYEYIFYWQRIHKLKDLKKIRHSKIVFFPMEDSTLGFSNLNWLEYRYVPIKIICFSKRLFDTLHNLKIDCFYVQYFIDPNSLQAVTDYFTKRVYFWNRTEEINWELIKSILGNNQITSLMYMAVSDPNNNIDLPDKNDIKKYNIEIYEKFFKKDEYINMVSRANIYIAPRKYEGIGMSFLEAFARGQCVIAPNYMTMNEYIENGVNGYLYELDNEKKIDLSNFEFVAKEGRKRALIGYSKWEKKQNELMKFILNDYKHIKILPKIIIQLKIKYLWMMELIVKILNIPLRILLYLVKVVIKKVISHRFD